PAQLAEAQRPAGQRRDYQYGPLVAEDLEHVARGAVPQISVGPAVLAEVESGFHQVPIYLIGAYFTRETIRRNDGHMRAFTQNEFGAPEVLTAHEVDTPTPIATEILVKVRAIGTNPIDAIVRSGQFALLGPPPFTLGWDVSGVV